ncbi:MAG: hypothetical protein JOY56_00360 [Solirubrobacterales bacterium]|nr:hypothetical protein [Solirubrobacterales bacterium]
MDGVARYSPARAITDSRYPAERFRGGPTRSARRDWGTLILAVVLAVAMGFLALGFFADAVGPTPGGSRIVLAVVPAICLVLLVVCGRWARRVEHRLRIRSQEVAQAYEARYTGSGPRPYVIGRGGRHYGPVAMGGLLAVCCLFVVAGIVGAVSEHAQAFHAGYVQRHGIAVAATVGYVVNDSYCSRTAATTARTSWWCSTARCAGSA